MRLLVGLGNPGPRFARNRHNIGFMALDEVVRRYGFGAPRARFHGLASEGTIGDSRIVALKPETFMNDSGRSVAAACQFYKLAPEEVVVIHDEIDLAFGKIRVKQGGGAGGHNGLRSIDAHIGKNYWRVRLGVGHPGTAELVHNHVLQDFAKAEQPAVNTLIDAVAAALPLMAAGDANGFMNKVTVLTAPPRPPKPGRDPAAPRAGGSDAPSA